MATKNATITIGGAAQNGLVRASGSFSRPVSQVHYDGEQYTQSVGVGGWTGDGSFEIKDADDAINWEGAALKDTIVVSMEAADANGAAKTLTIQNCLLHSVSIPSGDPGDTSSPSVSFSSLGDDENTNFFAIT